ncbi:MAG: signal peptidase I, partial [Candidatus Paceibacterota bacterium]
MLNIKYLLVFVLVIILFTILSPFLNYKNLPKIFIVTSASMEPAIKYGSLVFTKSVDPKLLKVGDIIAFSSPNNSKDFILHRVNQIKSSSPLHFATKGDNNNVLDQWDVTDLGVKGLYIFSLPYFGKIIAFVRQPLGFILIICIPAILLIISELFKIKNILDKKNHFKIIILLIIFTFGLSLNNIQKISAQYSSESTLSKLSFSIGDFISPESSLNLEDIYTQNLRDFKINATATDNISVSKIQLYYSYNYGPWLLFPDVINADNGFFHFTSPLGDGLYSFESLATDISNNI